MMWQIIKSEVLSIFKNVHARAIHKDQKCNIKEKNAIYVLLLCNSSMEQHRLIAEVEPFILGRISSILNKNHSCCREIALF